MTQHKREEEEFSYKELVTKEADKLQIQRILDAKREFGAKAKTMKWYQRARTFETTVYDIHESPDPIYQNMNCMLHVYLTVQFFIILHTTIWNP